MQVARFIWFCLLVSCPVLAEAQAPAPGGAPIDLRMLSLEELANITVTSVSRGEQPLTSAAAAITVVTNEDIRRSGATNVPDALRGVPGIHVARRTANTWAVSARGFSSSNSEKLLVLSDTRSLYTPLFSGVFWESQDYLMEDIDRIEVIRGPGAVLWGSNAVNGVVSIATKNARDTQGLYTDTSVGSEEEFAASARYGGRIGGGYYRVFGKYASRDESKGPPTIQRDDWQIGHGGFRADWDQGADTLTLQGDVYAADIGRLTPSITAVDVPGPPGLLRTESVGGNVLARWRHRPSDQSEFQLRAYYDRTHRSDPSFADDLDTIDLDMQHRSAQAFRQEITWGANYRFTANRNAGKLIFALDPPNSQDQVFSGFIQDQFALTEALRLTAGTKLEHNDFSGFEVQPSIRLAWQSQARQTLWTSVSRAVRVPTRIERDISMDTTLPTANPLIRLVGNQDFDSERLLAYEAGFRWQPLNALSMDLATFYNRYEGLASLELSSVVVRPDGRTVAEVENQNLTDGRTTGLEALVTATPSAWWRLSFSSSTLHMNTEPHGLDANRGALLDGATPRHQLGIRSTMDLGASVEADAMFRHLTAIRRTPDVTIGTGIPGYAELDVRLAWRRWRQVELALVGQNLLHSEHIEFGAPEARGAVERSVYAKVTWRR